MKTVKIRFKSKSYEVTLDTEAGTLTIVKHEFQGAKTQAVMKYNLIKLDESIDGVLAAWEDVLSTVTIAEEFGGDYDYFQREWGCGDDEKDMVTFIEYRNTLKEARKIQPVKDGKFDKDFFNNMLNYLTDLEYFMRENKA